MSNPYGESSFASKLAAGVFLEIKTPVGLTKPMIERFQDNCIKNGLSQVGSDNGLSEEIVDEIRHACNAHLAQLGGKQHNDDVELIRSIFSYFYEMANIVPEFKYKILKAYPKLNEINHQSATIELFVAQYISTYQKYNKYKPTGVLNPDGSDLNNLIQGVYDLNLLGIGAIDCDNIVKASIGKEEEGSNYMAHKEIFKTILGVIASVMIGAFLPELAAGVAVAGVITQAAYGLGDTALHSLSSDEIDEMCDKYFKRGNQKQRYKETINKLETLLGTSRGEQIDNILKNPDYSEAERTKKCEEVVQEAKMFITSQHEKDARIHKLEQELKYRDQQDKVRDHKLDKMMEMLKKAGLAYLKSVQKDMRDSYQLYARISRVPYLVNTSKIKIAPYIQVTEYMNSKNGRKIWG